MSKPLGLQLDQFNEIERKTEFSTKWLALKTIHYTDPEHVPRFWNVCERTTGHGEIDAVDILATLTRKGQPDHIVLALQYRYIQSKPPSPPLKKLSLEFPAGLVDEGETVERAALRELKEEIGLLGQVMRVSQPLAYEPGLTNSLFQLVEVAIDGDAPENSNPSKELDEGEFVETILLPKRGLYEELMKVAELRGARIDGKLATFALGLSLATQFGQ